MKYFFLLLLTASHLLQAQTQGDNLRQEIRVDQVYQQYGLTGQGVAIALIERGIDYTHPDFIDANGNTRIAYIYDMLDPAGANDPGNPYGIGTIYTRAQIDQALSSGMPLATNDRHGHGTACMGLAAGDGSGMAGAPYRGIAYDATIIVVKVTQDAFPATGNIAGQAGFFNPEYLPVALQFVEDKTIELGLPSATLINLGSIGGPTDGTSEVSRAMSDFPAPGRLLVCGVGDDGGGPNRAADTLTQGGSADLMVEKAATGTLRFEAWYDGNDRFDVSIIRPNGTVEGPFVGPATNAQVDHQQLTGISCFHQGADVDYAKSNNGQRQIVLDLSGATGTYTIRLHGATVVAGDFFASLNPAYFRNNNGFLNQIFPGASINDYASSFNTIVPTDYVFDTTYTDIDGIARHRGGEGVVGDLWLGSSLGPTLDGRLGVDIAVPGELCIGAYSPDTYYSQFTFNIAEGSNGQYGLQTAVSAAAPILTGTLALMLEVNPNLTVAQAKDILHQSARTDAFTGTVPNNDWGYGKLDALAAVVATQQTLGVESSLLDKMDFQFAPNPASEQLYYHWDVAASTSGVLELMDLQGRVVRRYQVKNGTGKLALPNVSLGVYLLRLTTESQVGFSRVIIE